MTKWLSVLLVILFCPGLLYGQKLKKQHRYFSAGINLNAMNYMGELDPEPGFWGPGYKFTRLNIGATFQKKLSSRSWIRAGIGWGTIGGKDSKNASYSMNDIYRKVRNLSVRNRIMEVKADVIFDLYKSAGKPIKRVEFTPYGFVGIAYFHHNPKTEAPEAFGGKWVALQPLMLEGNKYSLHQIAIPVGVGFRYKLNQRWDLAFEIGWRFTFTDYLDDVSTTYRDRSEFGDNALAIALSDRSLEGVSSDFQTEEWVNENLGYSSNGGYVTVNGFGRKGDQRGNSKRNDLYTVIGFHLTHIILKNPPCPKFRTN